MIERAPVHADANRLLILDGNFNHGAEIGIVFAADAHVAGIDAVLREGAGALGIFLQQLMSVVMEITDDGDVDALLVELLDDGRDRGCGLFVIDRDSNQFRARARQRRDLLNGEAMSAVSVFVMDCTTTGASLPTRTPLIEQVTVFLR